MPNNDVLVFNSTGKAAILPAQTTQFINDPFQQIKSNKQKLKNYVDFVHKTLHAIKSAEKRANKRKMSKKDLEKLNQLKNEIYQNELKILTDKNNSEIIPKNTNSSDLSIFSETFVDNFTEHVFENLNQPGVHLFDLVNQTYETVDLLGRKLQNRVLSSDLLISTLTYSQALILIDEELEKVGTQSDFHSTASSTKKHITFSEYEAFFNENVFLAGETKVDFAILKQNGKHLSEILNSQKFDFFAKSFSKFINFKLIDRDVLGDYLAQDFYFEEETFKNGQNKLHHHIDPTLDMDVCKFDPDVPIPENNNQFLQTIIFPKVTNDYSEFQNSLEKHKKWTENCKTLDKTFGNKNLANKSKLEIEEQIKIRVDFYKQITKIEHFPEFDFIFSDFFNLDLPQFSQTSNKPLTLRKSTKFFNFTPKNDETDLENEPPKIPQTTNLKKFLKTKSSSKTGSFYQERFSKFVQNYFETLEGKQYTINNSLVSKHVIFNDKEKNLIEELKNLAKDKLPEYQTSKYAPKYLPKKVHDNESQIAPNSSTFVKSTTARPQNQKLTNLAKQVKLTKKLPEPLCFPSLKERRQILETFLAEEESNNKEYHAQKNAKYDVYGKSRAHLPSVSSLYKQGSLVNENGDYLLDPIYSNIKNENPSDHIECFVKPSTLHKFRNYAPHHFLFQSLDMGFKNSGAFLYNAHSKGFICNEQAPKNQDVLIFPNQIDFGKLQEDGCFELKFTIVNLDWLLQKIIIKPPINCSKVSVVYSQEPFAPGLKKSVYVQIDTRGLDKGFFMHNLIVETKYRSYRVPCSGNVVSKNEIAGQKIEEETPPQVFMSFKDPVEKQPLQYRVRNLLKEPKTNNFNLSDKNSKLKNSGKHKPKRDLTEGLTSENLPRVFYDKNFTVGLLAFCYQSIACS